MNQVLANINIIIPLLVFIYLGCLSFGIIKVDKPKLNAALKKKGKFYKFLSILGIGLFLYVFIKNLL